MASLAFEFLPMTESMWRYFIGSSVFVGGKQNGGAHLNRI